LAEYPQINSTLCCTPGVPALTEIFVQERIHYSTGVQVSVQTGADSVIVRPYVSGSNRVVVENLATAVNGQVVTVLVTPK
jgi:hypothetical protein